MKFPEVQRLTWMNSFVAFVLPEPALSEVEGCPSWLAFAFQFGNDSMAQ